MQLDQKQLFQLAMDHPYFLFTGEQISELCNMGEDLVRLVRNAPDSPFRYNKCRPEWFTEWMRTHPDFQQTESSPPAIQPPGQPSAESVTGNLSLKHVHAKKIARAKLGSNLVGKA